MDDLAGRQNEARGWDVCQACDEECADCRMERERDRYRAALERIYQRARGDVLEIAREALNAS